MSHLFMLFHKFNSKGNLKTKMIVSLSIILLISSCITGYISYQNHINIAEKEINDQFLQKVDQVSGRVDLRIQELQRLSNSIIFNPHVYGVLSNSNQREEVPYNNFMGFNEDLNKIILDTPYLYSLIIYDHHDRKFQPVHSEDFNDLDEEKYIEIKKQLEYTDGEMIWIQDQLNPFKNHMFDVLIAARKVKDQTLTTQGILIMVVESNFLFDSLEEMIVNDEDSVYLFDNKNKLLYTNKPDDVMDYVLLDDRNRIKGGKVDENTFLTGTSFSTQTEFTLISHASMGQLHQRSKTIFNGIVMSGVLTIVIVVILFLISSNRLLSRPLKTLVNGMEKVREGDFDTRVQVSSNDELAYIGTSFNSMVEFLNSLIKDVYEKQLMQREAELTALQAQLNPHFLYNTLDMLRNKLYLQDDYENADLIVSLSQMIRYALEPANMYTSLKEEIDQVRHYLLIQKARFVGELEVIFNIANEVEDSYIARLLIQPLVENAFVHAFRDQVGEKVLIINAYKEDSKVVIEIIDNGCGMAKSEVENLIHPIDDRSNTSNIKTKHIGLHNIIRRLKLMYHSSYEFNIESTKEKGTLVRMVLPYSNEQMYQGDENHGH